MTRAARVRAHLDIVTANAARYEQWGKPVRCCSRTTTEPSSPIGRGDEMNAIDMNGQPLGPFKLGRHVLNYASHPWAWWDGKNFRGPMCRTRRGCLFVHWRRSR